MARQTDRPAENRLMKTKETERGRVRFRNDDRIICTRRKMIPNAIAGQKTYAK